MNLPDAAGGDRVRVCLRCEIVRWVADEPQPGVVEARVTDADGRQWSFLDKVAIFDMTGTVGPESSYTQPGLIRCEVLDDVSSAQLLETRGEPDRPLPRRFPLRAGRAWP